MMEIQDNTSDSAASTPAPRPQQEVVPRPSSLPPVPASGHAEDAASEPTISPKGIIPFNGVQITRATSGMAEEHAKAVRWLYAHGRDKGWSLATLGSKLRKPDGRTSYDGNTLYSVFRNRYGGSLDNVVASINTYRRVAEARELAGRPAFIETSLSRQIFRICESAVTYQRMALVFGDGQTGKSEALEEHQRRNNHGRTRYVRLPHGANYASCLKQLAKACYLGVQGSHTVLCEAIIASADAQTLFIVDELQQITLNAKQRDRLLFIEFLREIFDRCKCGVVICGTNEALRELETGPNAVWLRQLRRRALPIIRLPAEPTDEDVLAFAAHFGLGPEMPDRAVEVVRHIGSEHGVGQLITYLQATSHMAGAEGKTPTWGHFLRTVKALHELGFVAGKPAAAANAGNGASVGVNGNGKGGALT